LGSVGTILGILSYFQQYKARGFIENRFAVMVHLNGIDTFARTVGVPCFRRELQAEGITVVKQKGMYRRHH